MKGHPGDLQKVADQCIPGINALLLHSLSTTDDHGTLLTTHLCFVLKLLRDSGVNVDDFTTKLAKMALLVKASAMEGTAQDAAGQGS